MAISTVELPNGLQVLNGKAPCFLRTTEGLIVYTEHPCCVARVVRGKVEIVEWIEDPDARPTEADEVMAEIRDWDAANPWRPSGVGRN